MARRPSELTEREREVLELIRIGLTNDEIAERLGITSDGVKYHVSQVLAKLGVASRHEAVTAVYRESRRPWWRSLTPALLRIAGAGIILGTLAFVALLLWGTVQSDDSADPPDVSGLTPEEVYASLEQAVARPDHVLHSRIEATVTGEGQTEPYFTMELWVNAARETVRSEYRLAPEQEELAYDRASELTAIIVGEQAYVPDDPGEALRHELDQTGCPGARSAWIAVILLCGTDWLAPLPMLPSKPHVVAGEYNGRDAVVLASETVGEIPVTDPDEPPPSPQTLPTDSAPALAPNSSPVTRETQMITYEQRTHLAASDYLPLAHVITWEVDGEQLGAIEARYENEFLPLTEDIEALLDPRSIGYGAENSNALLDQIESSMPVYWLGEDFADERLGELVLARILVGGQPGEGGQRYAIGGELVYEGPDGWPLVRVRLWRPEDWEEFLRSEEGLILSDPACANRVETDAQGTPASVYILQHVRFPDDPGVPVAIPIDPDEPPPTPARTVRPTAQPNESQCNFRRRLVALLDTVIGVTQREGVVIEVRQDDYAESVEAMRSLMERLQRR